MEKVETVRNFALVGVIGFVTDTAVFFLLTEIIDQLMLARILAFWVAATVTWLGNRYITFGAIDTSMLLQWSKHMLSCHLTGLLNLAAFYLLSQLINVPVAFVSGILLGTISNYLLSSKLVFKQKVGAE